MNAAPKTTAPSRDWTRHPARPVAALTLGALLLGTLPAAFSRESPTSITTNASVPDMRLDLNAATFEELIMLPRIGEARARAILDHRAAHGPFPTIDSLDAVKGFGPRTIDALRPFITVAPQANPTPAP